MSICVVGASNQLFRRRSTLKQNFQKKKVVTGKTSPFVIGRLWTCCSICLNIGFWQGSFVSRNTKRYSRSLENVFVFQKISFKDKELKTFKISRGYHVKRYRISQTEGYFENPWSCFFIRVHVLSLGFEMKPLR